tara:strand:- start:1753 stop:1905 length:153 start_codon:yes stop_codon:yes gene_type:complete
MPIQLSKYFDLPLPLVLPYTVEAMVVFAKFFSQKKEKSCEVSFYHGVKNE